MFFYILGVFLISIIIVSILLCMYMPLKKEMDRLSRMIEKKKSKTIFKEKEDEDEDENEEREEDEGGERRNAPSSRISESPNSMNPLQTSSQDKNNNNHDSETLVGSNMDFMYQNIDPLYLPRPLNTFPLSNDFIQKRDAAVINDPLYPPLNRSSVDPHDNYRLLGYLVGEESTSDSWQLYGRKVNNTRSQFYARPTDKNIDMKIQIEDNMMPPRDRIRDLDNLPNTVVLDHPLFTSGTYRVTENPRTEFNSLYF